MTLTKSEYNILEATLQESATWLALIVSSYSHPWMPHDLSNAEVIDLLLGLQERNFIVAHATRLPLKEAYHYPDEFSRPVPGIIMLKGGNEIDFESWPAVSLTPEIIDDELSFARRVDECRRQHRAVYPEEWSRRKYKILYHMTPAGGAAWEEAAGIDWSKYHDWSLWTWASADLAPNQGLSFGRFGAGSLETLEAWFDWRLRWDNNIEPEDTLKSMTRWHVERVTPWKPYHWKTLPEGFECDFAEYEVKYPNDDTTRTPLQNAAREIGWASSQREFFELLYWYPDSQSNFQTWCKYNIGEQEMTRDDAWKLLTQYNDDPFHLHHAQVMEGVMKFFAVKEGFGEEAEFWGIVGLLHDLDFGKFPAEHCVKQQEIMREHGVDPRIIRATASHGWGNTGVAFEPEHRMERVLYATDELTGLIGAAALMRPSKSVMDMEVKSVKSKFKTLNFAAGCSRDVIRKGAEMLGWTLDELFERTLKAMKECEEWRVKNGV